MHDPDDDDDEEARERARQRQLKKQKTEEEENAAAQEGIIAYLKYLYNKVRKWRETNNQTTHHALFLVDVYAVSVT
jgi:hypothetical protein